MRDVTRGTTTKRSTKEPKPHVAVRLKPEEIARLDAQIPQLSTPWHEATRSDALRAALLKGLAAMEQEAQQQAPVKEPEPPQS